MKNIKLFDRRLGFSLGAASILFGTMAPAVIPAFASADSQLTGRSVDMSTSAAYNAGTGAGTNVSYAVTFTPTENTTADMAVEFCSNTPLIGASCTAPTGMVVGSSGAGATVSGDSAHILKNSGDTAFIAGSNYVAFVATLASGSPNTITISGVRNPSTANTSFYARILSFGGPDDSAGSGGSYAATGTKSGNAAAIDGTGGTTEQSTLLTEDGSVALSTGSEIGVTADVLESLTFCVFGDPGYVNADPGTSTANTAGYLAGLTDGTNGPSTGCAANSTVTTNSITTNMQLGQHVASGVTALLTSTPSYQAGWTQISTNAQSGAAVFLKTSNSCLGLHRNGDAGGTCAIPGIGTGTGNGTPTAGQAGFGLTFGGGASHGSFAAPSGAQSGGVVIGTNYLNGAYGMDSATTGTYGGSVYTTNSLPAADQNVPFGLGAAIANNTPSGQYSANLDLIAVGTF